MPFLMLRLVFQVISRDKSSLISSKMFQISPTPESINLKWKFLWRIGRKADEEASVSSDSRKNRFYGRPSHKEETWRFLRCPTYLALHQTKKARFYVFIAHIKPPRSVKTKPCGSELIISVLRRNSLMIHHDRSYDSRLATEVSVDCGVDTRLPPKLSCNRHRCKPSFVIPTRSESRQASTTCPFACKIPKNHLSWISRRHIPPSN